MKKAIATLKSSSPYSQSRFHDTPRLEKEAPADYERRTWRNRLHTNENGNVIIPPMQFKNSITEAAQYMSMKIQGKGNSTWSKHFLAGIMVCEPLELDIKAETVQDETLLMDAQGRRGAGSGSRVMRTFPIIKKWNGTVTYHVLDDAIDEEIFRYHLEQAGLLIGIGRFRPRNGGFYGRYSIEKIDWK